MSDWARRAVDASAFGFGATFGALGAKAAFDAAGDAAKSMTSSSSSSSSRGSGNRCGRSSSARSSRRVVGGVLVDRNQNVKADIQVAVAPASPAPLTLPKVIYQNQRYIFFKWKAPSFPTDRWEWSDETGEHQLPSALTLNVKSNTATAEKTTNTTVSTDPSGNYVYDICIEPGATDAEGWSYAIDFPRQYYPENWALAAVRRRKWALIQ